jgi:hypothetical protein
MKRNIKDPESAFVVVVVAVLLILTAWGSAIGLLVFSAVALAVWLLVPRLRGQIELRRGIVVGAVSVAVAIGIACAIVLSRSH